MKFSTDLLSTNKLVSSAYNLIGKSGTVLTMSFTYNKNNNGPETECCGTPQVIQLTTEFISLTQTN